MDEFFDTCVSSSKAAKYTVNSQAMTDHQDNGHAVLEATISYDAAGKRLDQVLVELFPEYSRNRLQYLLKQGAIVVNNGSAKASDKVHGGESVALTLPDEPRVRSKPQAIPLDVVYEDEALLVVNKPAGLVVHPGAGNPDRTLENALLNHDTSLDQLPRAGLVHRIDKDTTGLLVVAKTVKSHAQLVSQLEAREFQRIYEAVCVGSMTGGGSVNAAIARHPSDRTRMAVRDGGRPAVTHYRIRHKFRAHTQLKVQLETGRTHQIRVHLAHIRYPLVGDPVYGRRLGLPAGVTDELAAILRSFKRQALHAESLGLRHPDSDKWVEWTAPRPPDLQDLIVALGRDHGLDNA